MDGADGNDTLIGAGAIRTSSASMPAAETTETIPSPAAAMSIASTSPAMPRVGVSIDMRAGR